MPHKRIRKQSLWLFFLSLLFASAAVAQVPTNNPLPVMNAYGMPAPFLMSWLSIWIFALAGGFGSLFIKIDKIDERFRNLYVAKPFLGVFGALAMCIIVTSGGEPPEGALTAYAFFAAFASAPLLQGLLTLVTSAKNQLAVVNSVSPVKLELPEDSNAK